MRACPFPAFGEGPTSAQDSRPSIESDVKPTVLLYVRQAVIERPGDVITTVRRKCAGADDRWVARVSPGFLEPSGLPSRAGNHPSIRASGAIASFGSTRGHSQGLGPWADCAVGHVREWMLPLEPLCPGERRVAEGSASSHSPRDLLIRRGGSGLIAPGRTPPGFSTSPAS